MVVVDDGLATGATMKAALHTLRAYPMARLVCAVPVASSEAARDIRALADDFVCLHTVSDFGAVGLYYRRFDQVSDDEVVALLRHAAGGSVHATRAFPGISPAPASSRRPDGTPSPAQTPSAAR